MNQVGGCTSEEYQEASENGKPAELRVWSVLRGGFFYNDCFFYCGTSWMKVRADSSIPLDVRVY
jgi:hypothetical protein